jgi:predicted TIM-barrel fold metal-dependent hydrolase
MEIFDIHWHTKTRDCEDLIEYAQKLNIKKACLLGDVLKYGYNPNKEQIREINDQTMNLVVDYPSFFLGFCHLNPRNPRKFIEEEMERCILKGRLRGVKLEASTFASDKRVFFIADICQSLNIPILLHCWNTLSLGRNPVADCYQTDPEDVVILSKNFPKLKIIVAHLRGIDIRGIIEIKSYENIYVDTSGAQPICGIIEFAVKKIGSERILFGSDVYFPNGRDIPVQLMAVLSSKIKERDKENILFKNAMRILGYDN